MKAEERTSISTSTLLVFGRIESFITADDASSKTKDRSLNYRWNNIAVAEALKYLVKKDLISVPYFILTLQHIH